MVLSLGVLIIGALLLGIYIISRNSHTLSERTNGGLARHTTVSRNVGPQYRAQDLITMEKLGKHLCCRSKGVGAYRTSNGEVWRLPLRGSLVKETHVPLVCGLYPGAPIQFFFGWPTVVPKTRAGHAHKGITFEPQAVDIQNDRQSVRSLPPSLHGSTM